MFDIHIEEFYFDCCKTLTTLYQSFPKKCAVFVEGISGQDQPDEYGVHSDRFLSCFGAMVWLADEGYLQYESTIRQEAIDQATLSSKGLHLLANIAHNESINAITEKVYPALPGLKGQPTIETLKHLMKHGTSSQLGLAMQYLLGKHSST